MLQQHASRREFLAAVGGVVVSAVAANEAGACRRWRPQPSPPLPPPYLTQPPFSNPESTTLRIRQDIASFDGQRLESLRRGIAYMQSLPSSDRRSWLFQANTHG